MIIQMIAGNKVVDVRQFPDRNIFIEGYVEGMKQDMLEQNEDILDLSQEQPEFRLELSPDSTLYKD